MAVTRPEEMNAAFADAVSSGDVERVLALYEPDALLAPRPGVRAGGLAEIRAAIEELLALGGTMQSRNLWCMEVGELALLRGEWHLRGTAPDGHRPQARPARRTGRRPARGRRRQPLG